MSQRQSPEPKGREIRRKIRRKYAFEEKIHVVLECLRGEETIPEVCRREGIHPNHYYRSSKDFLEVGKKRLQGEAKQETNSVEVDHPRNEHCPKCFDDLQVGLEKILSKTAKFMLPIGLMSLCLPAFGQEVKTQVDPRTGRHQVVTEIKNGNSTAIIRSDGTRAIGVDYQVSNSQVIRVATDGVYLIRTLNGNKQEEYALIDKNNQTLPDDFYKNDKNINTLLQESKKLPIEQQIGLLQLLIEKNPKEEKLYLRLGKVYGGNNLKKGLDVYIQGILQIPNSYRLYNVAASNSYRLNQINAARLYLQSALRIDPNNDFAKAFLKQIN